MYYLVYHHALPVAENTPKPYPSLPPVVWEYRPDSDEIFADLATRFPGQRIAWEPPQLPPE